MSLIDSCCDVNMVFKDGQTLLHMAAFLGHMPAVDKLIDANVSVNVTDIFGMTPLHYASKRGIKPVIEKLVNAGSSVNTQDNAGHSVCHMVLESHNEEAYSYIFSMPGNDIQNVKEHGHGLLQDAISKNNIERIHFLTGE